MKLFRPLDSSSCWGIFFSLTIFACLEIHIDDSLSTLNNHYFELISLCLVQSKQFESVCGTISWDFIIIHGTFYEPVRWSVNDRIETDERKNDVRCQWSNSLKTHFYVIFKSFCASIITTNIMNKYKSMQCQCKQLWSLSVDKLILKGDSFNTFYQSFSVFDSNDVRQKIHILNTSHYLNRCYAFV